MLAGEVNQVKQKTEIRPAEEWKSKLRNGMYTVKDVVKLWQVRTVSATLTTSTLQATNTSLHRFRIKLNEGIEHLRPLQTLMFLDNYNRFWFTEHDQFSRGKNRRLKSLQQDSFSELKYYVINKYSCFF